MRIIAGSKRGKKLALLENEGTRPTSDRARESLFNILNNYLKKQEKDWNNIVFVDTFAGTGAVGVEAASRGARRVFFFENNPLALKCLRQNCGDFPNITIFENALKPLKAKPPVDILFLDPPYQKGLWQQAVPAFLENGWIGAQTIVVIETDKTEPYQVLENFMELDKRSYGRNTFLFWMLAPQKNS